MNIHCVIPSRNRPAQLDLLLRSVADNLPNLSLDYYILYSTTSPEFEQGYQLLKERWPEITLVKEVGFQTQYGRLIAADDYVMLMVDDLVAYRPSDIDNAHLMRRLIDYSPLIGDGIPHWCYSLRLGNNTIVQNYLTGERQSPLTGISRIGGDGHEWVQSWNWKVRPAHHNWGYMVSLDACLYKSEDLLSLAKGEVFDNPRAFESVVNRPDKRAACCKKRMVSPTNSLFFSNAVNCVQQTKIPAGVFHPFSAEFLNDHLLAGRRLYINSEYTRDIQSCHLEIPFEVK